MTHKPAFIAVSQITVYCPHCYDVIMKRDVTPGDPVDSTPTVNTVMIMIDSFPVKCTDCGEWCELPRKIEVSAESK